MHLETYPIAVNVGRQWKQVEDSTYEIIVQSNLTFLYIGNNEEAEFFSPYFKSGIFTEDYIQAQILIERFNQKTIPDVIFIDLPLNKVEFMNFHSFLEEKNMLAGTVLIYNENKLDESRIKFLKQKELIDDVVRIDSQEINYSNKISFLKKIKTHQDSLHLNSQKLFGNRDIKNNVLTFKRMFDIIGSLFLILLFLPIFIMITLAVKFGSKGPIIYTSLRAGKGFKVFKFYKFRTMITGADAKIDQLIHLNQYADNNGEGPKFLKLENDPRVTKIGKILRKTSIDELPQLFNVLKGDMSLVGNRPLPLYEASTLTTNEFVERFMAPAGMTGLWQIKKRGGKAIMSTEDRINLDILYARTANPILDLWIMAKTPTALFQKSNG